VVGMAKKAKPTKPRVGFFGMTSCKGCFFQFMLLGSRLLDVFDKLELEHFWMLKGDNDFGEFDIAVMDGAVSNEENAELVRKVRDASKYLIAFGTCACFGGIPALRNGIKGFHEKVYGEPIKLKQLGSVDPLDRHVKVDYHMFGCPVNENEVLRVVRDLLLGKKPREPDYPVCVDCKKAGISCLLKDGIPCMGPVTNAGCGAPCPASRSPCDGCRGKLPDANWGSETDIMLEHGITTGHIDHMFKKYTSGSGKEGRQKK
jgi:sulfhydrogenase subunit delta